MDVARTELLVRLLTRHQDDLFRYIFALLPNEDDARDVLQETSVALYRKFEQYDSEKAFFPWACGFAFLEVLKQRDRSQRKGKTFDHELIERLAEDRLQEEPEIHRRLNALEKCLEELAPKDRELIRLRYQEKIKAEALTETFGPSRRSLFRNLVRIRRLLHECVTRRVAEMG